MLGNAEKMQPETWRALARSNSLTAAPAPAPADKIAVGDIMAETGLGRPRIGRPRDHTRGFVQVQNGCDHRCTFCVIPFGRGRSRSRDPGRCGRAVPPRWPRQARARSC